ncbi:MAG: Ig-like domain-containing protein, partial [Gemmatimonadota bacterium]|nr:Ig-like domain-containing protein [Gemmatimonadota bacterium]
MSTRRPDLILALALLTACGGDGPVDPGNGGGGGSTVTVASVTVSPASASILVGATQQFSASATDTNGGTVTGATVSWSSSNSSVASVSSTGLATGAASGTATITATISGVAGSQVLSVTPVECSNRQEVSLEAGERTTYEA